ncbi:MAG: PRD domain-containing protein [Lachnospira eligens]
MLKRRFPSKTDRINMHICFLIERLVTKTPIENYENLDAFEAEQQEFINIKNESFHTLVSYYNVELPVSETAYLYEYIKNDVKVEGNENHLITTLAKKAEIMKTLSDKDVNIERRALCKD